MNEKNLSQFKKELLKIKSNHKIENVIKSGWEYIGNSYEIVRLSSNLDANNKEFGDKCEDLFSQTLKNNTRSIYFNVEELFIALKSFDTIKKYLADIRFKGDGDEIVIEGVGNHEVCPVFSVRLNRVDYETDDKIDVFYDIHRLYILLSFLQKEKINNMVVKYEKNKNLSPVYIDVPQLSMRIIVAPNRHYTENV